MTVFSWIGTPFPISSSQSIYAKPQGDEIQQNFARVGSQEIDDLFDEASRRSTRSRPASSPTRSTP